MEFIFVIFGAMFVAMGVLMTLTPGALIAWLSRNAAERALFIAAIGVRAVLAVVFLAFADLSAYPLVFQIIGLLGAAGALFVLLLGPGSFADLLAWLAEAIPRYVYVIEGPLVVMLGAFIIWAVL